MVESIPSFGFLDFHPPVITIISSLVPLSVRDPDECHCLDVCNFGPVVNSLHSTLSEF